MGRILQSLSVIAGLSGNLIPLAGVLYWNWDTFQLLMLYWTETTIAAFWVLLRLSRLSPTECGTFIVNGREKPATARGLVGFFAIHSGGFILVHLFFLLIMFSHDWLKNIHGVGEFLRGLYITNGVWVALLFVFISQWVAFLVPPKPQNVATTGKADKVDQVGAIVGTLYVRIFIMQAAIIFGAWYSGMSGSMAPLVIVIGLKTLIDLGAGMHASSDRKPSFSVSMNKTTIGM